MAQTFNYQPLANPDDIRILILLPAELKTADVHVDLIHTTLEQCEYDLIDGGYTALSYVWGDQMSRKTIWINEVQVTITANLHQALLNIRDAARPIRMWADAVCINQSDESEKNYQVRIMGRIYAGASHTIIYVGANMNRVCNVSQELSTARLMPPETAEEIVQKPWFGRVWVLQELIFSKDPWIQHGLLRWKWDSFISGLRDVTEVSCQVHCYDDNVSNVAVAESDVDSHKEYFSTATDSSQGEHTDIFIERVWYMHNTRQTYYSRILQLRTTEFFTLVSARRGLNATDPRDMIFAYIGFTTDGDKGRVHIDYTKSFEKVYIDFALHQLRTDGNLRLLTQADELGQGRRQLRAPTWVPDWRQHGSHNAHSERRTWGLRYYNWPFCSPWAVGLLTTPTTEFQTCVRSPPTLLILGCRPETVIRFSVPLWFRELSKHHRSTFGNLHKARDILTSFYQTDGESFDWETYRQTYDPVYNAWRDVVKDDEILPPLGKIQTPTTKQAKTFPRNTLDRDLVADCVLAGFNPNFDKCFIEGRRLARFSSGRLALVPAAVKLGDIVIHSNGYVREPFLFRPCRRSPRWTAKSRSIRAAINTLDIDNRGLAKVPIKHCTFVGPLLIHGLEYREANSKMRICDMEFWGYDELPPDDTTVWPRTIYAVR